MFSPSFFVCLSVYLNCYFLAGLLLSLVSAMSQKKHRTHVATRHMTRPVSWTGLLWLPICSAVLVAAATADDHSSVEVRAEPQGALIAQWLRMAEAQATQPGGSVLFLTAFIILYILTVPCTILETTGGFFFGGVLGFALGMAGKMLGTLASMVLARTVLQTWVRTHIAPTPTFRIFERMVQKSGFRGLFLSRLLPNLIKNYGVALLDIPQHHLAAAVLLNNVPFSVLWAYVGSSTHDLVSLVHSSSLTSQLGYLDFYQQILVGAVLLMICTIVTFWGRAQWQAAEAEISREDVDPLKQE